MNSANTSHIPLPLRLLFILSHRLSTRSCPRRGGETAPSSRFFDAVAELAVEEVVLFTQGLEFLSISVSAETHLLLGSPRLGTVRLDTRRIFVAVSPEEMCGVGARRHDVIRLRGEAP